MGDIFSLGFGPFRWVCMSQNPTDLCTSDRIACECLKELESVSSVGAAAQIRDNIKWIERASSNNLVVGSQVLSFFFYYCFFFVHVCVYVYMCVVLCGLFV
jgi:urocanate hydratase